MNLVLFNTLGRHLEPFEVSKSHTIQMYTCGPTVYNHVHIGNWRAYVFADILKRYLKYSGYSVRHVMNITDVDDKTIKGANANKISLLEYTKSYKESFLQGMDELGIETPDVLPCVTDNIEDIISFIKKLLLNESAYTANGSVYFRINSSPHYGKLALLDRQQLQTCNHKHSNDVDEYDKEKVGDFVLWKGWKQEDGPVYWESEFGKGRPGWHIECTVLATKYLNNQLDIHTGGVDLIFPHHTNEIAQTEAVTNKRFSKMWLHNAHLTVGEEKMSKSLNNFLTIQDIKSRNINPIVLRFVLFYTHFQSEINFTEQLVTNARATLKKIVQTLLQIENGSGGDGIPNWENIIMTARMGVELALNNNLNTFAAIQAILDFDKQIREKIADLSADQKKQVFAFYKKIDAVFNIFLPAHKLYKETRHKIITEEVISLAERRNHLKHNRQYDEADKIRLNLEDIGVLIRDLPSGAYEFELNNWL